MNQINARQQIIQSLPIVYRSDNARQIVPIQPLSRSKCALQYHCHGLFNNLSLRGKSFSPWSIIKNSYLGCFHQLFVLLTWCVDLHFESSLNKISKIIFLAGCAQTCPKKYCYSSVYAAIWQFCCMPSLFFLEKSVIFNRQFEQRNLV